MNLYIADTHFGHSNVIRFDGRPFKDVDDTNAMKYFESDDKMMHVEDIYQGKRIQICMCHYPMLEWYRSFHGTWHIYGHIHNLRERTYEIMRDIDHALNAGASVNNYAPASFRELVENNKRFRES